MDAKTNIEGDIFSKAIAIETGAIFNGNCKIGNVENIKTTTEPAKN
ncbi:MAG: hypothetical protein DAHOPDDO_01618 [Ignavibacteriaceae bacterium]|nr:hypothetical protein [Ignavibacteriaceae bacterium]